MKFSRNIPIQKFIPKFQIPSIKLIIKLSYINKVFNISNHTTKEFAELNNNRD